MRILFFILSAISLILVGAHFTHVNSSTEILLLIWIAASGVVLVYSMNPSSNTTSLKQHAREYLKTPFIKFNVIQFFLLAVPLAFVFLPSNTLLLLMVSALLGTIYSFGIPIGKHFIKLKNILVIKNLMIGLVWGALIIIGAGDWHNSTILALFAFASFQIFIGSSMRDAQDVEKDKVLGINTIPAQIGVAKSIKVYYVLNLISLFFAQICNFDRTIVSLFSIVIVWKTINIYFLNRKIDSAFWGQYFNIATSYLIYVLILLML